jgi:LmbE family N-acetylglucosaminyl deacetylase
MQVRGNGRREKMMSAKESRRVEAKEAASILGIPEHLISRLIPLGTGSSVTS